jgi:uncharacterized protein (TIGR02145 family)
VFIDPATHFCRNGIHYGLCDGEEYNPPTQGCEGSEIVELCNGKRYNPPQICDDGIVFDRCSAGLFYNSEIKFCYNNTSVHDLCGGKEYNLTNQRCENGVVETRCGTGNYHTPATQFCNGNDVLDKCGGTVEYVPETEACCGTSKYTVATQECGTGLCAIPYEKTRMHYGREKTQFCDERDGQKYVYVTIGSQTWMAENLNYGGPPSNPNSIGMCVDASGASGTLVSSGGRCATYGRLYNWNAAMNNATSSNAVPSGRQGVCPEGWHLPSDAEWDALTTAVGGTGVGGRTGSATPLKSTSGWDNGGNGQDTYGFSALPSGNGNGDVGLFDNVGVRGFWWSATESPNNSGAWSRFIYDLDNDIARNNNGKTLVFSVRCVKSGP